MDLQGLVEADEHSRTSIKGEMRKLYPEIHRKLTEGGWQAKDMVKWLGEHGMNVSVETFRVYLHDIDREHGYDRSSRQSVNTHTVTSTSPIVTHPEVATGTKDGLIEILQVASQGPGRSKSARLREIFDEVEKAKAKGASLKQIVTAINEGGLEIDMSTFVMLRSRIKRERALKAIAHTTLKDTQRVDQPGNTQLGIPTMPIVSDSEVVKATNVGMIKALRAVSQEPARNKVDRLREIFDEVEEAKAKGASNKQIVAALEAHGLFFDVNNFKNTRSRILKERALAGTPAMPIVAHSEVKPVGGDAANWLDVVANVIREDALMGAGADSAIKEFINATEFLFWNICYGRGGVDKIVVGYKADYVKALRALATKIESLEW